MFNQVIYKLRKAELQNYLFFLTLCMGCSFIAYINSLIYWLIIILFNIVLILSVGLAENRMNLNAVQMGAVVFMAWIVVTRVYSKYKIPSVNAYFVMGYIVVTFVTLVWYLDCDYKIIALMKAFVCGELVQALFLISIVGVRNVFSKRMETDIINANTAGIGFGTAILISILLFDRGKHMIYLGFAAFFSTMLFLSGSRTALVSLIVGLFTYFRDKNMKLSKIKIRNIIIALVIIAVVTLLIFSVDSLYEIIGKRVVRVITIIVHRRIDRKDASTYTRFQLYRYGLKNIIKKPFLGYGWDQYRYYVKAAGVIKGSYHGKYVYSHSNVIELLFNTGIVGLLMFYMPTVYTWVKMKALKKKIDSDIYISFVYAIIMKLMVESFFSVYINNILSWITMAIICSIMVVYTKRAGAEII